MSSVHMKARSGLNRFKMLGVGFVLLCKFLIPQFSQCTTSVHYAVLTLKALANHENSVCKR